MAKVTIIDNSGKIKSAKDMAMARALEEIGMEAEGNAVNEATWAIYDTPQSPSYVRTGTLRNSITHTTDKDSAYVGTNIEYAPYVEMGTSRMRPRPFIKPAVENYMDDYKEIAKDHLLRG